MEQKKIRGDKVAVPEGSELIRTDYVGNNQARVRWEHAAEPRLQHYEVGRIRGQNQCGQ